MLWAEKRLNRENQSGRDQFDPRNVPNEDLNAADPDSPLDMEQRRYILQVAQLGRDRNWQEALSILATVAEPGPKLRTAAISACARALQLDPGVKLFEAMPQKTTVAYNALMTLLGRMRRTYDCERLLQRMKDDKLSPSCVTYCCLMNAYGMVQDGQAVARMLDELKATGARISAATYGSALGALARAGDKDRAFALLREMEENKVQPGLGHLTSAVVACARGKDEEHARAIIRVMLERSIPPDVVTYTGLIASIPFNGEAVAKAESVISDMKQQNIKLDVFVYNELMQVALGCKLPEKCRQIYDEMTAAGVPPTRETELRLRRLQELEQDVMTSKTPSTSPLPPGWHEATDPASGQKYYWNQSDPNGSTTWDRPIAK